MLQVRRLKTRLIDVLCGGDQKGRIVCSDAKKKATPRTKTAAELAMPTPRAIAVPQRPSPPASEIARLREPTVKAASVDTVIAVPKAIANVASTPAHSAP